MALPGRGARLLLRWCAAGRHSRIRARNMLTDASTADTAVWQASPHRLLHLGRDEAAPLQRRIVAGPEAHQPLEHLAPH